MIFLRSGDVVQITPGSTYYELPDTETPKTFGGPDCLPIDPYYVIVDVWEEPYDSCTTRREYYFAPLRVCEVRQSTTYFVSGTMVRPWGRVQNFLTPPAAEPADPKALFGDMPRPTGTEVEVLAGAEVRVHLARLFEHMERAGISQSELARRMGKHRSQIHRWFRGDVAISAETLIAMGRHLGLRLDARTTCPRIESRNFEIGTSRNARTTASRRMRGCHE